MKKSDEYVKNITVPEEDADIAEADGKAIQLSVATVSGGDFVAEVSEANVKFILDNTSKNVSAVVTTLAGVHDILFRQKILMLIWSRWMRWEVQMYHSRELMMGKNIR